VTKLTFFYLTLVNSELKSHQELLQAPYFIYFPSGPIFRGK